MSTEAKDPTAAEIYAKALLAFAADLRAVDLKPSTVQHKLDGVMYTSTKLPARVGLELLPRITTLLGAGMLRLVATGEGEGLSIDRLAAALVATADRALRDGLVPLVLELLANTQCGALRDGGEGKFTPDRFDSHFAGDYLHLLKVCALVLAHNFRGPTFGSH
jgi:hypothetical protein